MSKLATVFTTHYSTNKFKFYYYVFHSYLAPTCFGLTAIISELTAYYSTVNSAYIYQMCRLKFTVYEML